VWRTALFMTVQEHCKAYCRHRETVKLFRFLLSPYSLIGTLNSVENCTFRWPTEMTGYLLFQGVAISQSLITSAIRVQEYAEKHGVNQSVSILTRFVQHVLTYEIIIT
jgi:hypothetical protein